MELGSPQVFSRCIIDAIKYRLGEKKISLSSAVLSKYDQDKCKLIRNLDNSHIKCNGVSCVCQHAKSLLSCCSSKIPTE